MRIHRIALRNFRGVTEADVSFAATGVTIIEGDNEVGKSSLIEALHLALEVKDSSTSARVKAVLPVGRDVGAEVEVELRTGPYHFTYRKVWGRGHGTALTVAAPSRRQLTGSDAHDAVRAMLGETVDLALLGALHLQQGGELRQADYSMRSLGHALDQAASAERSGEREDALWDRVVAERSQYWTPTGKPHKDRVELAGRLACAETTVAEAESALHALEGRSEDLARFSAEATALAARQTDLETQAQAFAEQAQAVDSLRGEVRALGERHEARVAGAQSCRQGQERRLELIERVAAGETRLTEAELRQAGTADVREVAGARHRRALAAAGAAGKAAEEAEIRHALATADEDHRRREIELDQLTERRDRVTAAEGALDAADTILDASTVDDGHVAAIEAAYLALVRAEASASAAGAQVVLRGLGLSEVVVDGMAQPLVTGEDLALAPAPSGTEVVVPGSVAVTVTPGSVGLARAEAAAAARHNLAHLCQEADVTDLDHARALAGARADAQRDRALATRTIADNLRDLTQGALAQKVQRLTARIDSYRTERPTDPAPPADLDAAQAEAGEARESLARRRRALDLANTEAAAAAIYVQGLEVDDAGLAAEISIARTTLTEAEGSLARARQDRGDDLVTADLVEAEALLAEADAVLRRRQADLAVENPDGLDILVANALAAQKRGAEAIATNRERRQSLQAVLESQGEQGLAQRRDVAATMREHLSHQVAAIEAQAEAALLLHDRFAARRDEARTRYATPFRSRIEQLGRLVFGPTLEVDLSADLRVATRTLQGATVSFDQLSTGAREQLDLLSRMACAAIVANEGGAPIVFDDALGWTDPARLEKMGAALDLAGRECQIIVLTCTPERYSTVGNATVIRLPGGTALAAVASA